MQQVTFKLVADQERPVVIVERGMTALLDTGAYIPLWTDEESILIDKFGATLHKTGIKFTGYGGVAFGNHYKVTLKLGAITYPNMSIIANQDLDTPFNLILSATMFKGMIYEIDDVNHFLNITVPDSESMVRNLRISEKNGRLHVLCNSVWTI